MLQAMASQTSDCSFRVAIYLCTSACSLWTSCKLCDASSSSKPALPVLGPLDGRNENRLSQHGIQARGKAPSANSPVRIKSLLARSCPRQCLCMCMWGESLPCEFQRQLEARTCFAASTGVVIRSTVCKLHAVQGDFLSVWKRLDRDEHNDHHTVSDPEYCA